MNLVYHIWHDIMIRNTTESDTKYFSLARLLFFCRPGISAANYLRLLTMSFPALFLRTHVWESGVGNNCTFSAWTHQQQQREQCPREEGIIKKDLQWRKEEGRVFPLLDFRQGRKGRRRKISKFTPVFLEQIRYRFGGLFDNHEYSFSLEMMQVLSFKIFNVQGKLR